MTAIPDAVAAAARPLSFSEQLLWLNIQSDGEPIPFLECLPTLCLDLTLRAPVNVDALSLGLRDLARRHRMLRACYAVEGGGVVRRDACDVEIPIEEHDVRRLAAEPHHREIVRIVLRELERPFELTRAPLARATLLQASEAHSILFLNIHRLVCDSASRRILAHDLTALYESRLGSRPAELAPVRAEYDDYVRWQRERIDADALAAAVDEWECQGSRARSGPWPLPGRATASTLSDYVDVDLGETDVQRLRALARRHGITMAMMTCAVVGVLMHERAAAPVVTIGLPISDRRRTEFERTVGSFNEVLVLHIDCSGAPTFGQLLARTGSAFRQAYDRPVPYSALALALRVRGASGTPRLFTTLVNFGAGERRASALPGGAGDDTLGGARRRPAAADVSVHVGDVAGGLGCRFVYKVDLFTRDDIRALAARFVDLVRAVLDRPDERIDRYAVERSTSVAGHSA